MMVLLIGMMAFPQFCLALEDGNSYADGAPAEDYDFRFSIVKDSDGESYAVLTEVNEGVKDLTVPDYVKAYSWKDGLYEVSSYAVRKMDLSSTSSDRKNSLESLTLGSFVEEVANLNSPILLKKVEMSSVKKVGRNAFSGCSSLASVEIPEAVEIGSGAFKNCENLEKVVLGPKLEKIGLSAFSGAQKLTSIEISPSVKSIGTFAFQNCDLAEVVLPEGLQEMGADAFSGNVRLKSIHIPAQVASLQAFARNCPALESLTVDPANACYESSGNTIVEKATKTVVQGCSLSQIPEGVEHIAYAAFTGCSALKEVVLPESLRTLEDYAFWDCASLQSLFIPKNVESVSEYSLIGCSRLESIEVSGENKTFDSREGCQALVKTATNELLFGGSKSTIPEGIAEIGEWAFNGNESLTSITIPSSVEKIGQYAFYGCNNLTDVYSLIGSPTAFYETAFSPLEYDEKTGITLYTNKVLHVLPGMRDTYCQTKGWSNFQCIFGDIGNPDQVEAVPFEENSIQAPLYDLSGRQLQKKPTKGIYIQGGKKRIAKNE